MSDVSSDATSSDGWPHATSSIERDAVVGDCPACGAAALARYPVLAEGGWFLVTKCQMCLHSVERSPWHRLGHVQRLEDQFL